MPSLQESFFVEVIALAGLFVSPRSRSQRIVQIHHTDGVRDSQIGCSRVAKEKIWASLRLIFHRIQCGYRFSIDEASRVAVVPTHDNLWLVVRDVLVAATGRRDFQDVVDLNDAVVRVANILV